MKVLIGVDGSSYSQAALEEVARRPWPAGTEVEVLSVAHPVPFFPDPIMVGAAIHMHTLREESERASRDLEKATSELRQKAPELRVNGETREGSPKEAILKEAEAWGADLIVVGSHGRGAAGRFLLGSVSQAVVLHAPCSVEVVRSHSPIEESALRRHKRPPQKDGHVQ
jgi:nucleotide-binding universal stress UspA family protein